MTGDPADRAWMGQALALAGLGEGRTSPNPQVGCVLVRDGLLVGAGYHHSVGRPHAEAAALTAAGDTARGATAYVNLEPCAHHGKTPPCCDALIAAGISRVVTSVQDPNPRVDGLGFTRLRDAGIRVEIGLLADEARRLNGPFFHWHATGEPSITLKAALSLDGMLAGAGGESRWITGPESRLFAHRLRFRHDAILIGAETLRRDNPRLTVRLAGIDAPRMRVVVSASMDLDPASVFFRPDSAATSRIYTTESAARTAEGRFDPVVSIVGLPEWNGAVDLGAMVKHLGDSGIQSLLVEGGGKLQAGLLERGLAHRVALFSAPKILGANGGTPWLPLKSVQHPDRAWRVDVLRRIPLGEDSFVWGDLIPVERAATEPVCSPA